MSKRSFSLQTKLVAGLFAIVLALFVLSAYLLDQLSKASTNVAAGQAASQIATLERSIESYHDLVDVTKRLEAEIAQRLAARADVLALDPAVDLKKVIDDESTVTGLRALALVRPDGTIAAESSRPQPGPQWRDKVVDQPLGNGGELRLTFSVSATISEDMLNLKQTMDQARQFAQIREALPSGYRTAFLVLLGVAGVVTMVFGIWMASSVTRRIAALVSTAQKVSEGHHDARVELRGGDEMAELGTAFNTMLDDLDEARVQVEYLQRMGVWQDVARRLAHEIKNPLTPIQLAVQQCVSSYKGDDARFQRLLADTGEIVEEEIASLRRLVDTFRTLGALPKVEAAPLELAEVIEELKLDPTMAQRLTLDAPDAPVTVRADKLLLKRVLANLVENGIHAGQEAGKAGDVVIGWTADARADRATITVDDQGKGVAEESREKIFEPYVTTKSTGTGLGLAIARKIAIEHGGELRVAPGRAPTGGARFVVSLPLRGEPSPI